MFTEKSFEIFEVEGLEERMMVIRNEIQPIFQELGEYVVAELEPELGVKLPIHIAQHWRRSVYPPESTWVALGGNTRGYKSFPHFQVEINGEHIAMWLALIDQPKNKIEMAEAILESEELVSQLPEDTYFSLDHTQSKVTILQSEAFEKGVIRLRDIKKGELLVGRILPKGQRKLENPREVRRYMLETYQMLIPLYKKVLAVQSL